MMSKLWRERLVYLVMSLAVAWHSLAIIVAPAPDGSAMIRAFRVVLQPYLSLFRLDNKWNFFAPSVGKHSQFRYVVEDAGGTRHVFIPAEQATRSIPRYVMWREFKYLYEGVMEAPEIRGAAVTALLCQEHAALKPVSISLQQVRELDYWPEDYLRGRRPLDREFISVTSLTDMKC